MFAVPGWSVPSSSLKTQITENSSKTDLGSTSVVINASSTTTNSNKKRKRNNGKPGIQDVDAGNLTELWEIVIEGNPKKKKKNAKKLLDKKPKVARNTGVKAILDPPDEENKLLSRPVDENTNDKQLVQQTSDIDGPPIEPVENPKSKKTKRAKEKKSKEKKAVQKSLNDSYKEKDNSSHNNLEVVSKPTLDTVPPLEPTTTLTPLQAAMRQKLVSARFRHLNQTLYTTSSAQSLTLFQQNPEMFAEYHEGFRRQVEVWPENPVESYVSEIKTRGQIKGLQRDKKQEPEAIAPLPRTNGICNIADLGCGDAALSTNLQSHLKQLQLKLYSFDLQSTSNLVTKADIANLPLADGSIDVAIFCLALMGTNWIDFIEEAFRVLRWKGELWIAEIKSRFGRVNKAHHKIVEHSVGNRKRQTAENKRKEEQNYDAIAAVEVDGMDDKVGETDVNAFVDVLRRRGFVLCGEGSEAVDLNNKMFVKMRFIKGISPIKGKCVQTSKFMDNASSETWKKKTKGQGKFIDDEPQHIHSEASVLKPCVYKLR